jgi:hypothetical protein
MDKQFLLQIILFGYSTYHQHLTDGRGKKRMSNFFLLQPFEITQNGQKIIWNNLATRFCRP